MPAVSVVNFTPLRNTQPFCRTATDLLVRWGVCFYSAVPLPPPPEDRTPSGCVLSSQNELLPPPPDLYDLIRNLSFLQHYIREFLPFSDSTTYTR